MTDHTITDRAECIKFLRQKNTKVAIEVGFDGPYVFVEKGDFINTILKGTHNAEKFLCDYDGVERAAYVRDGVLHIPVGVN